MGTGQPQGDLGSPRSGDARNPGCSSHGFFRLPGPIVSLCSCMCCDFSRKSSPLCGGRIPLHPPHFPKIELQGYVLGGLLPTWPPSPFVLLSSGTITSLFLICLTQQWDPWGQNITFFILGSLEPRTASLSP